MRQKQNPAKKGDSKCCCCRCCCRCFCCDWLDEGQQGWTRML